MICIVQIHPLVSSVDFSVYPYEFLVTRSFQEAYYVWDALYVFFCSQNELPEPEQDNGGTTESVKEQEMKWTDLALQYLHENVPPTGN